MKRITRNETIVERIAEGGFSGEYAVGEHAALTLILLIRPTGKSSDIRAFVHLRGKGASATIVGLVMGTGNTHVNISTLQHHQAPETTSNLLVKTVLSDSSACTYTGSITVDKDAQKTDAYQRNENLLLDSGARAVSSPALEILANDVRCTHGAVVKTLDETERWYLASRGIDPARSRAMIANGFLLSALDTVGDDTIREEVGRTLADL